MSQSQRPHRLFPAEPDVDVQSDIIELRPQRQICVWIISRKGTKLESNSHNHGADDTISGRVLVVLNMRSRHMSHILQKSASYHIFYLFIYSMHRPHCSTQHHIMVISNSHAKMCENLHKIRIFLHMMSQFLVILCIFHDSIICEIVFTFCFVIFATYKLMCTCCICGICMCAHFSTYFNRFHIFLHLFYTRWSRTA